jgi:hypothetical protein
LIGAVGCCHLGREPDNLPIGMTHIISRPRRQRLQAAVVSAMTFSIIG